MGLHEQGFNYGLAKALRSTNARWSDKKQLGKKRIIEVEEIGGGRRPDILIDDRTMAKVVIECEIEGGKDKDAPARLKEDGNDCRAAIAVRMRKEHRGWGEDEVADHLLAGAELLYAVHQIRDDGGIDRFPSKGWLSGSVGDLAALVPWASTPPHQVKQVANAVVEKIVDCADILQADLHEDDVVRLAERVKPSAGDHPLRTLAVLWLDAFLVQRHLRTMNGKAFPSMPSPNKANPLAVADGWDRILETNWHAIFRPAVDALREAAELGGNSGRALGALIEAVNIIETERMGDRVQVGAELFPKLCEDRKESAAFYTTPVTAEMLAAMTIRRDDRDGWLCPDGPPRLADFACGTGTLLRAGLRRIMDFHQAEADSTLESLGKLHQAAMTHRELTAGETAGGVTGADVSAIAAHLTNSTLAVMGRGYDYQDTNIGWLATGLPPAGIAKDRGPGLLTGSLEFLASSAAYDLFARVSDSAGGQSKGKRSVTAAANSMDYILMNPPYSRTRGGQSAFDIGGMTEKQRDGCQRRWEWLLGRNARLGGMTHPPATKTAGMAASFLAVAHRMARPGGRIGFVLPLTAAFATSWQPTRKMLVECFQDIAVVGKAGASGGDDAMSDDTHMGEMMLVATKRKDAGGASPVFCASLRSMPMRMGEAGVVGRAVVAATETCAETGRAVIRVGNDEIGSLVRFDGEAGAPWSHLGALHPELSVAALALATDGVLQRWDNGQDIHLQCGMTTVRWLFRMGPTHHLIGHLASSKPSVRTGAFTMHPVVDRHDAVGEDRALWNANAESQRRLLVGPTHKGLPYAAATAQDKANVRGKMGRLFYQRNMRWTSQKLLAASTSSPMHGGSSWTSLMHADDGVLCAMSLWFNSIFGMLVHWSQASRQQEGRARTQVNAVRKMPCPNAAALTNAQLRKAAEWFAKIEKQTLLPARKANEDPARRMIDEAVVDVFGLPNEALDIIDAWRCLWVAEPTVSGAGTTT